ncbi:MAG: hypothetical protein NC432_07485 [Roseburia sp.]|nr:hypothetical protein [Roseburia sp.]MCM1098561.1 hypothetical protein [Ruminococcus flavefaciens]
MDLRIGNGYLSGMYGGSLGLGYGNNLTGLSLGYGGSLMGLGYGNDLTGLRLGYGDGLTGLSTGYGSVLGSLTMGNVWKGGLGLSGLSVPYQNFAQALQKALGERQSLQQGRDVMMGFPPTVAAGTMEENGKKPSEMTREEYQKDICGRISSLSDSVDAGQRGRGLLVLKEEALDRMQREPDYEKQVLEMLRKDLQTQKAAGSSWFGCRVIGGSAEECYGLSAAAKRTASADYGNRKSLRESRGQAAQSRSSGLTEESAGWASEHAERLMSQAGRREGLTERLIRNRTERIQERAAGRQGVGEFS